MGFLNPGPDDEYRIASQAQGGTTDVPGAGMLEGALTSVPKGLAVAGEKVGDFMSELGGAFDPIGTDQARMADGGTSGVYGENLPNSPNASQPQPAPSWNSYASQASIKSALPAAQIVSDWAATGQDPRDTGAIGRILAGTSENLAIGAAGAVAGGPWGAAALLGGTQGYADFQQNKKDGMDDNTAMEKAGLTGGMSAASAFIPMKFGNNIVSSIAGGAAINAVTGAASRAGTAAILDANGYHDMASQYRVFDGEAMASDVILGAAFGAHGHVFGHGAALPADVDAALATSSEDHFNRSSPGVATTPDVANTHVDLMRTSIDALAKGDEPDVPAPLAQKMVDGTLPDPTHDTLPMLNEAAHDELNNYDDVIKPIDAVEPPTREPGEPLEQLQAPEPKEVAEGEEPAPKEPAPTPMDDMTMARMNSLLSRGVGDMPYTDEEGNQTTVQQKLQDMQQQMGDSDRLAKAHEIAAACFIGTGGAA